MCWSIFRYLLFWFSSVNRYMVEVDAISPAIPHTFCLCGSSVRGFKMGLKILSNFVRRFCQQILWRWKLFILIKVCFRNKRTSSGCLRKLTAVCSKCLNGISSLPEVSHREAVLKRSCTHGRVSLVSKCQVVGLQRYKKVLHHHCFPNDFVKLYRQLSLHYKQIKTHQANAQVNQSITR